MKTEMLNESEIGWAPKEWSNRRLRDILQGNARNGVYKPPEFHGSGVKIINMGELFAYPRIAQQPMKLINLDPKEIERFIVHDGDLLFARRSLVAKGAGKCSIVVGEGEPRVFESSIIRLRPDPAKADSRFLFYFFRSSYGEHLMDSILRQVAVSGITGFDLVALRVPLPPLPEQMAIANNLGALEDKIELNSAIGKTLEEIARTIFKHWFIDFEFPKENGDPYKSSGGKMTYSKDLGKDVPEGWNVSKLSEVTKIELGGTPDRTRKEFWNGDVNWINSGKVNEFRIIEPSEKITKEGLEKSATKLLPKGTVVLAITGATLGQVSRLEIDSCANQSVIGILENATLPSEYLYFWAKSTIVDIIRWQTGGAQQHINKGNVENSYILIPFMHVMEAYADTVRAIFARITSLCFESQNMERVSRSLLPRLMSGKIRIPVEVR